MLYSIQFQDRQFVVHGGNLPKIAEFIKVFHLDIKPASTGKAVGLQKLATEFCSNVYDKPPYQKPNKNKKNKICDYIKFKLLEGCFTTKDLTNAFPSVEPAILYKIFYAMKDALLTEGKQVVRVKQGIYKFN